MHLISVIIPCYNAALFLGAAIESVLEQTHIELELILVNDGSTDNTEQVILLYNDDRIRYFRQENKGQGAAFNKGIAEARGRYIKFFDADDVMNKRHLEEQLNALDGNDMAVASCRWGRFYNNDPSSAVFVDDFAETIHEPIRWLEHALLQRYDMMPGWLWLIPRQLLQKAGSWDERLSLNNDFEFSIRLLLHATSVQLAANAEVYYRSSNKASLSKKKTKVAYESAFLSVKLGCSYLLNQSSSNELKRLCANKYLFWMYQIYPDHPELVEKMEIEVKKLGGGDRKIGGRSKLMHFLQQVIGWKATKKIWLFSRRIGYTKWGSPLQKKLLP